MYPGFGRGVRYDMGLISFRSAPTSRVECPGCRRSVEVEYDEKTHVHSTRKHSAGSLGVARFTPCPGAETPIAFMCGRYAAVALLWRGGKLLAISRKYDESDLGLPGGKDEPDKDSDPFATVVRETEEESGVKILRAQYVYYRLDFAKPSDPEPTLPAFCFLVEEYEGEPRQMEAGAVKWIEPGVLASAKHAFSSYNTDLLNALSIPYSTG